MYVLSAMTLALSLFAGAADARVLQPGTPDQAIRLRDGRVLQTEYIPFYALHKDDPGFVIFEDGSAAIIDREACTITGPNGAVHALNDC